MRLRASGERHSASEERLTSVGRASEGRPKSVLVCLKTSYVDFGRLWCVLKRFLSPSPAFLRVSSACLLRALARGFGGLCRED